MSIELISTSALAESSGTKCSACGNPPCISFNRNYAVEHPGEELHNLLAQLENVRKLKSGTLYACGTCGGNWVLDGRGRMMTRVPPERNDLLAEWDTTPLPILSPELNVMKGIGATAPARWLGSDSLVEVPCAVSLKSGEKFDPAVVWITTRAPIDVFGPPPRLHRDVAAIEPSRFALPLDVRRATESASEFRMGFAPTRVVAADGTPFVLHWATSVFNHGGIAGNQVSLSRKTFDPEEKAVIVESDMEIATTIFADWFAGAEDLARSGTRAGWFLPRRWFR